MLAAVINQPPAAHGDGPTAAGLPGAVPAEGGGHMNTASRTSADLASLTPAGSNT